jgi:hypothetical protein
MSPMFVHEYATHPSFLSAYTSPPPPKGIQENSVIGNYKLRLVILTSAKINIFMLLKYCNGFFEVLRLPAKSIEYLTRVLSFKFLLLYFFELLRWELRKY